MVERTAQAGTLESSDCLVTVAPGEGFRLDYRSRHKDLFEERTERIAREVAARFVFDGAVVQIDDQGALEATLRARLQTAFERACKKEA